MKNNDKRVLGILSMVIIMVMAIALIVLRTEAIEQRDRLHPAEATGVSDGLLSSQ